MMHTNVTNNPLLRRVQRHANMATLFRQPDIEPAPRPSLPPATSGETAVTPPQPAIDPQPAPAESADEAHNWRRLQTIYRQHEARIAAEERGEGEETVPPLRQEPVDPPPAAPTPQTETAVQRTPDPQPTPEPPAPVRPDPGTPTVARQDHKETPPGTFGGSVAVKGSLTVGGPMTVGGSTKVSGPATVGGGLTSGTNVRTGPAVVTGGVTAGTDVKQIGGSQVSGDVTSGSSTMLAGGTTIGQSVTSGSDVKMAGGTIVSGSVEAGNDVKNAGPLSVGGAATVGNDATIIGGTSIAQGLTTGNKASILGGAQITGSAEAGNDLTVIGPATISGAATTGGNINVAGSASIGGSATVGGSVKAGGSITVAGELQPPIPPAGGGGGGAIQRKPADEAPSTSAPEQTKSAPLESVWPGVQRKPQVQPAPEPTIQRTPQAIESQTVTGKGDTAVSNAPAIQQKLAAVQPGQPTDSAVELVLPRRPRPNQPVQAKAEPESAVAKQQFPNNSITQNQPPPANIATDIGLLPADLWQLVGRTPPHVVVQRRPESGENKEEERETAVTPQAAPDTTESNIQRRTAATEPAEAEDEETGSDDEIDVDELAQRVFQDLRRRLAVEWERARGRLQS